MIKTYSWAFGLQCFRLHKICATFTLTLCTPRMSALDIEHMEDMEESHIALQRGTVRHHPYSYGILEHTLGLCQHRRSLFGFCDRDKKSSDTLDTPWSTQMDNHSLQASSALSHVTWHNRQRTAPHDHGDFVWEDTHCRTQLHTRCRKRILQFERRRCICRTLECLEGKDSSLHLQCDCIVRHPLDLKTRKLFETFCHLNFIHTENELN